MIGISPAHGIADNSIVSAMRLVAARHGERVKKNNAETIVPPLASAIHQTYSAIASPQATGMLTPQTPIPFTNSHAICTIRASSSANEQPNPIHHQRGAPGSNTRLLTSSLNDASVT